MDDSVTVVIPAYNAGWCLQRAITSCQEQSYKVTEILIVDDASSDNTFEIIVDAQKNDKRIRCLRLEQNVGHLSALRSGLRSCTSAWAVLLDADDELTVDSVEVRLQAAKMYHSKTGEWPQLVYGDLYRNEPRSDKIDSFKRLEGLVFEFLSKELSLCQTSTIMLGSRAIQSIPNVENVYNTDDEIVVAIGKRFPVLHAGKPVVIAYDHSNPTRMSNCALQKLKGITQLVRNHRTDIVSQHGRARLFYWYLRILRAFLGWQIEWADSFSDNEKTNIFSNGRKWFVNSYKNLVKFIYDRVTRYLRPRFEQMYF